MTPPRKKGKKGGKEGMGGEGNRWEGRMDGGGKRREEKRAREKVHNLRKNDPPGHQMAGYGHVCVPNF